MARQCDDSIRLERLDCRNRILADLRSSAEIDEQALQRFTVLALRRLSMLFDNFRRHERPEEVALHRLEAAPTNLVSIMVFDHPRF